jgi:hypothetical protein
VCESFSLDVLGSVLEMGVASYQDLERGGIMDKMHGPSSVTIGASCIRFSDPTLGYNILCMYALMIIMRSSQIETELVPYLYG